MCIEIEKKGFYVLLIEFIIDPQKKERKEERVRLNYIERCLTLHVTLHENHTHHHMWRDCHAAKEC